MITIGRVNKDNHSITACTDMSIMRPRMAETANAMPCRVNFNMVMGDCIVGDTYVGDCWSLFQRQYRAVVLPQARINANHAE